MAQTDVVVVGGGIVGLATARALLHTKPGLKVLLLEKEHGPAVHQSGRNSGVIHSGVYYRPGSLKARTVAVGRQAMFEFCTRNGIVTHEVGKVIVAVHELERGRLRDLRGRAEANGVVSELIGPGGLADLEPHAAGLEALHVPSAAVVDFGQVCGALARELGTAGGEFRPGRRVLGLVERTHGVVVTTEQDEIEARVAVNCAGLHSDILAAGSDGWSGDVRIVPFRGEYHHVARAREHLVRTMIYPVPDPQFPFLGVHFTRGVNGRVHAGPNAVLALAREGYSWRAAQAADTWDLIAFPGFRRLAARHWRTGLGEVWRSLSKSAFVRALQRLVPDITAADLEPAPAGVRAQAVDRGGALVDDFLLHESARTVHVLNAPSPAATASLEIGRLVARRTLDRF